jgi:hypothetical protein
MPCAKKVHREGSAQWIKRQYARIRSGRKKARHEAGLTGVRRISAKDRFTMRQNEI